jgi:putative endonuclease
MSWFVYIVRCADDTLYTGVATDVVRRVAEHNAGPKGARYTASRRPVHLVFEQTSDTRSDAMREEWRIKRLPRSEKLNMIENWEVKTTAQEDKKKAASRGKKQPSKTHKGSASCLQTRNLGREERVREESRGTVRV